jgi:hypothetical protein
MNIFASLKVYAGKWSEKESREFTADEIAVVQMAVVVPSQYGNSVQFLRKDGGMSFIPLENDANTGVGEVIDLTKAKLVTLEKQGEADIYRVRV